MKLKRYHAPDIRRAINKVRDELGPDAVILSNRPIDDGVEIIAAIDYDDAIVDSAEAVQSQDRHRSSTSPASLSKNKSAVAAGGDEPFWKRVADKVIEQDQKKQQVSEDSKHDWLDKLNDPRLYRESLQQQPDAEAAKPAPVSQNARGEQAQDLTGVWNELQNLRGLLEHQLSSLAWGELASRHPYRAKAMRSLLELGIGPAIARQLIEGLDDESSFEKVWRQALTRFALRLPVIEQDILTHGGMFALVGPTGVGKTTTLAKMAARFALQQGTKDIALVTTDNYRVGAQEQLRTYGRILETPVRVANDGNELRDILHSLRDKKLVLIDTAGMSQRDIRLTEQFAMLSEGAAQIKTLLVLSASSQMSVLDETVEAYARVALSGCILTKLDESNTLGGVLTVASTHQLPIAYISDGQRVPEDLHREDAVKLIKRGIAMMKRHSRPVDEEFVEMAYGGLVADDVG